MASRLLTLMIKSSNVTNIYNRSYIVKNCFPSAPRFLSTTRIMSGNHLNYTVKDEIAIITFNSPGKVNSLNQEVFKEFEEAFIKLNSDSTVKAAVLISKKTDCFIAGADINMLKACKSASEMEQLSREGQKMLMKIQECSKPVVSAIMGSCLGGGLEVSLASHYRIAVKTPKTQLGLPEVQLGLLPGAGGTQRLTDLVPLDQAIEMMLTGKNIKAEKALKMGLVNQVVDLLGPGLTDPNQRTLQYLEEVAIQTAKDLASGKLKKIMRKKGFTESAMGYLLKFEAGRNYFFKQVKDKVMKQTKGVYPAPLKIIDVVRTGLEKGKDAGYDAEAKAFGELGSSSQSKGLIGLFDGMTACKKNKFGKPKKPVKSLAVLGAGLMGAGITHVSVDKGINTLMKDVSYAGLARGQQQIEMALKTDVKKKKITQFENDQILSNLVPTLSYNDFSNVDMVIEAVFEDIKVKHNVLQEVEKNTPEHCIFATNTSALSIKDIASISKRPDKVIGMHYFSPVDKMMLLELITYDKTSEDTIASTIDVGLRQGKVVIVVKDSPGFYTTRCLAALVSEGFELVLEGLDPKDLDRHTQKMGFPVGSATLVDEVGIDVAAHINEYLSKALGDRLGIKEHEGDVFKEMVAKGYLGRKSGKGIYVYEDNSKNREVNFDFLQLLKPHLKIPKIPLTDKDIRLRILGRFVNQCLLCLQEGILATPIEGDIGAVFGLGFPPFLGGPFRFVDIYGADQLLTDMLRYQEVLGDRFKPCQLLLDHAKDSSKKFYISVTPLASVSDAGKI